MFLKNSRYYDLDDIVTPDSNGIKHKSKMIRRIPRVDGKFEHNIEAGDRLDLLANRYYRKPLRWWRICDANSDIFSPIEMLGDGVMATIRLYIDSLTDVTPFPWRDVVRPVSQLNGVEQVNVYERVEELFLEPIVIGSETVNVNKERFKRHVDITFNRNLVTDSEIRNAALTSGVELSDPVNIGRAGKPLTIPPIK